ncbi:DUF2163 domain-containing protein [Gellertiella hungarica]|uniref:Putative phage protein (TIGR02218 family) n=1 Tax=Gellertiella hungarica TaxID=1572859 RepID=A0A7W6NKR3_9HYPH|nr:DUF2163 domain-containing protein [Gellertiella hungarica]MBB4065720.1 putative phage protein (TIGR02218 family) [Gellertiella hungarica]
MRRLSAALAAHLAGGATTLCHCWKVTRRDGVVLGFTDHDRDIAFGGVTFRAGSGFTGRAYAEEAGLPAAAGEIEGAFSSPLITPDHLAAGLYDGAEVDLHAVNWARPEERVFLSRRDIGEVTVEGNLFRAELRPLTHRLHQPQGRAHVRTCSAEFADSDCALVPVPGRHRGTGRIAALLSESRLAVTGLSGFDGDDFSLGRLTFESGVLAGTVSGIAASAKEGDRHILDLWLPPGLMPAVGDRVGALVGCDKRFETCRNRFANGLNFRGFPHMPGPDFAYSYADRDTAHDGRALVP